MGSCASKKSEKKSLGKYKIYSQISYDFLDYYLHHFSFLIGNIKPIRIANPISPPQPAYVPASACYGDYDGGAYTADVGYSGGDD